MKAILQLAESGTFLGQVDLFKVRGKFASTDAYEDHFILPKGKILLVTQRRVSLLQVRQVYTLVKLWLSLIQSFSSYSWFSGTDDDSEKVQSCEGSMLGNLGCIMG